MSKFTEYDHDLKCLDEEELLSRLVKLLRLY